MNKEEFDIIYEQLNKENDVLQEYNRSNCQDKTVYNLPLAEIEEVRKPILKKGGVNQRDLEALKQV